MADKTKISWTNATWNPIRGCSRVSDGCVNCYAEKTAYRFSGVDKDGKPGPYSTVINHERKKWNGNIMFVDHMLDWPMRREKPRMIFVNSMSDLFHENVKEEWIDKIFAVMALSPQHTFQILTKRPKRMREYLNKQSKAYEISLETKNIGKVGLCLHFEWPLKNVWLGVSVENQATADERIPLLLDTPAAIRWISAEPLLGPIDLTILDVDGEGTIDALSPHTWEQLWDDWKGTEKNEEDDLDTFLDWYNLSELKKGPAYKVLDWIVVGGESGPGAREFGLRWADSLLAQCNEANTAIFIKQMGSNPFDIINQNKHFIKFKSKKGADKREWPIELQIQQYPQKKEIP